VKKIHAHGLRWPIQTAADSTHAPATTSNAIDASREFHFLLMIRLTQNAQKLRVKISTSTVERGNAQVPNRFAVEPDFQD